MKINIKKNLLPNKRLLIYITWLVLPRAIDSWNRSIQYSFLGFGYGWVLGSFIIIWMKSSTYLYLQRWNFGMFHKQPMRWLIGWPRKGLKWMIVGSFHCSFLGFCLIVIVLRHIALIPLFSFSGLMSYSSVFPPSYQ